MVCPVFLEEQSSFWSGGLFSCCKNLNYQVPIEFEFATQSISQLMFSDRKIKPEKKKNNMKRFESSVNIMYSVWAAVVK